MQKAEKPELQEMEQMEMDTETFSTFEMVKRHIGMMFWKVLKEAPLNSIRPLYECMLLCVHCV